MKRDFYLIHNGDTDEFGDFAIDGRGDDVVEYVVPASDEFSVYTKKEWVDELLHGVQMNGFTLRRVRLIISGDDRVGLIYKMINTIYNETTVINGQNTEVCDTFRLLRETLGDILGDPPQDTINKKQNDE